MPFVPESAGVEELRPVLPGLEKRYWAHHPFHPLDQAGAGEPAPVAPRWTS